VKRQLGEVLWVVGGQALTALGTIVGVRILTQYLNPSAYGVVSLSLGMSTLAISLVATPLTQAAIHFYPSVVAEGSARELLDSVLRCYRTMAPRVVLLAFAGGGLYMGWGGGSPILVALLAVLLTSDCWRSANLSLLNAARRQRRFALWMAADAWSRPLAATAAVLLAGQSPVSVLEAYVLTSAFLLVAFSYRLWPDQVPSFANDLAVRSRALDARMWSYALPLVPLGIIGWAGNLGDRYIIGGVLSVADAGLYAAVYGLASSPFMIVGGTVEQGLRPIYQTAVSCRDYARSRKILGLWLAAVVGACLIGVIAFAFGHRILAAIFVGKQYRHASALMPWIAAGYAIRSTSYVFERVCYAYGQTRRVLITQCCAVAAATIVTPLGVLSLGLTGAALAVPVYFSVQLAVAITLARRTIREASGQMSDGTNASEMATSAHPP
jgi:O-antigen/teichoic acid export membrane protein